MKRCRAAFDMMERCGWWETCCHSGGIIRYDKAVVGGVVTLDNVGWLC